MIALFRLIIIILKLKWCTCAEYAAISMNYYMFCQTIGGEQIIRKLNKKSWDNIEGSYVTILRKQATRNPCGHATWIPGG